LINDLRAENQDPIGNSIDADSWVKHFKALHSSLDSSFEKRMKEIDNVVQPFLFLFFLFFFCLGFERDMLAADNIMFFLFFVCLGFERDMLAADNIKTVQS
jgi:hypothetical protein